MCKVERDERSPIQRDVGAPGDREQLQGRLSRVGQAVRALDQALDRAEAMVAPLLDDPRCLEAHPALAHACRMYEATVAAVTRTRQQLFDLPMLVRLLAYAPLEERRAARRWLEQHCSGLCGIEEALEAAAMHVVRAWRETRADGQEEATTRGG